MKRYAWILLLVLFTGCDDITITTDPPPACPPGQPCPVETENPYKHYPPVDLPIELRQTNWGGGSCVFAAFVHVLRAQGQFEVADWVRKTFSGGETIAGLVRKAEAMGVRFDYRNNGDVSFLEWCSRTRRAAVIFYKPNHAIAFNGFVTKEDGKRYAVLVDNNRIQTDEYVPYDQFVRSWKGYGGVAFTTVYTPTPPLPWI